MMYAGIKPHRSLSALQKRTASNQLTCSTGCSAEMVLWEGLSPITASYSPCVTGVGLSWKERLKRTS